MEWLIPPVILQINTSELLHVKMQLKYIRKSLSMSTNFLIYHKFKKKKRRQKQIQKQNKKITKQLKNLIQITMFVAHTLSKLSMTPLSKSLIYLFFHRTKSDCDTIFTMGGGGMNQMGILKNLMIGYSKYNHGLVRLIPYHHNTLPLPQAFTLFQKR